MHQGLTYSVLVLSGLRARRQIRKKKEIRIYYNTPMFR